MIDENEFFRKTTLKICGSLKIEEGLRDCIRYLSDFMPADNIYLESYEEDIGAMRYVARADKEKGELLNVLVPLSAEAKARAEANVRQVRENPDPFFMSNQSDENPIARDLLKALGHPPSSILGISLAISGQFVGAVLLIAAGSDRFNAHHAKLFATLKEPFFVAMSNALQHREVLKFKDLLADDNRFLQSELRRMSGDEIVGANFGLKPVMYQVQQVATLGSPVLILGETGTGKDVIANAIHYASTRSDGPFVSVNCGAIPDSLIDSELFGHDTCRFLIKITAVCDTANDRETPLHRHHGELGGCRQVPDRVRPFQVRVVVITAIIRQLQRINGKLPQLDDRFQLTDDHIRCIVAGKDFVYRLSARHQPQVTLDALQQIAAVATGTQEDKTSSQQER